MLRDILTTGGVVLTAILIIAVGFVLAKAIQFIFF